METAIQLVLLKRERQIKVHGRTVAHDIESNPDRQLAIGASALLTADREDDKIEEMLKHFPSSWDKGICRKMLVDTWKERVVTSTALMLAELERIIEIEKNFSNPVLKAENIEDWKSEFNAKMKLFYNLDRYIPEMIGDDWQTNLYEGYTVDDAIKDESEEWHD